MAVSHIDINAGALEERTPLSSDGIVERSEVKIRSIVLGILIITLPFALLLLYFRAVYTGLITPEAMDFAQLGRNMLSKGFSTSVIRPLALDSGTLPSALPETLHGPLFPLTLALAFGAFGAQDAVVVGVSAVFYLLTLPVVYLLGRRMFGHNVGILALLSVTVNSLMLDYSATGLHITLYIFLMTLALLIFHQFATRQRRAEDGGGPVSATGKLVLLGLLLGLLYLTDPIFIFAVPLILVGVATVSATQRWRNIAILAAAFFALSLPWMIRNANVAGNPVLGGRASEVWMNTRNYPGSEGHRYAPDEITGSVALLKSTIRKVLLGVGSTIATFPQVAGSWILAFFLPALLFRYSDPSVNETRRVLIWTFLSLFVGYVFLNASQIGAMAIFVSLVPTMLVFAVSYLVHVVQQAQLSRNSLRFAAFLIAFAVTYPLLASMAAAQPMRPEDRLPARESAKALKERTQPSDVALTDQPWIVAWYADRRAVLIPSTTKTTKALRDGIKDLNHVFLTSKGAAYSRDWGFVYSNMFRWNQLWSRAEDNLQALPGPAIIDAKQFPEGSFPLLASLDKFQSVPPSRRDLSTVVLKLPPAAATAAK